MRKHIGTPCGGSGGYALAADAAPAASSIPAGTLHGCVSGSTRVMEHVYESNTSGTVCPSGSFLVYWGVTGPKGAPGPSGIVSTTRKQLITACRPDGLDRRLVLGPQDARRHRPAGRRHLAGQRRLHRHPEREHRR